MEVADAGSVKDMAAARQCKQLCVCRGVAALLDMVEFACAQLYSRNDCIQ